MMALKILILILTIRPLEPQKFPSHQNAALAMPTQILTSSSAPPRPPMIQPRQVKLSTSPNAPPPARPVLHPLCWP